MIAWRAGGSPPVCLGAAGNWEDAIRAGASIVARLEAAPHRGGGRLSAADDCAIVVGAVRCQ
jgi:hypothetical protein